MLQSYRHLIRARWIMVLAGIVTGLAVAAVVVATTPPRYASEVTMVLSPTASGTASSSYDGETLATQKAKSYTSLLDPDLLARELAADPSLPPGATVVPGDLSLTLQPDTPVVVVRGTAGTPLRAQQVVQAVTRRYELTVAEFERPADPAARPVLTIRTVGPPTLNTAPVTPRPALDLALGAVLGLAAGLAAAVVAERRRRPIRSVADAEAVLPVLGSVPARVQSADCLRPGGTETLGEDVRRLRARLGVRRDGQPGRVVLVVSPSPGDGRSTVAAALAAAWARTGARVVLVDADRTGPGITVLATGVDDADGLTDVAAGRTGLRRVLRSVPGTGLTVLPAGTDPPPGIDLPASLAVRSVVTELGRSNDVVVVDTPAVGDSGDALALASWVDEVVLVARRDRTSAIALTGTLRAMTEVGAHPAGVVLTAPRGRRAGRTPAPDPLPSADDGDGHVTEPPTGTVPDRTIVRAGPGDPDPALTPLTRSQYESRA